MNGTGLVYKDQETAEAMADLWRQKFYSLLTDVSTLNNEPGGLDSLRLSSLLGEAGLSAANIRLPD